MSTIHRSPEQEWFMRRVTVAEEGCWLWPRTLLARDGYGLATVKRRTHRAHRLAYELFIGPIPSGLESDHLCRVRHCVNPDHLEMVTHAENMRRRSIAQTHCKHGHEYTPENTYLNPSGWRACHTCAKRRKSARREAERAA